MKNKNIVVKLIQFLSMIPLYFIAGKNSLFLYITTLSLYHVFLSCFKHITIKDTLRNNNYNHSKFKILKYTSLIISTTCLLFVIISILLSDTINILLDVENTFLPYLIMSISIITEPLIKILLEYLESYNKPKLSNRLLNLYYILETIFLLLISLFTIIVFKLPIYISTSLLYISKILSFILVTTLTFIVLRKQNIKFDKLPEEKANYKKEISVLLKNNSHTSIVELVKNSYYYISIIILYTVLTTRYSYNINVIEKDITFIYLFGLSIINFIIDIVILSTRNIAKKYNIISYILKIFQYMMTITIILGITSPLVCKLLFNDSSNSVYLTMLSFLLIFITLYNITFENIKNKKLIYISLIIGITSKIIFIVPLINSFYRMGYNLVYGDIISTVIGMFISIMINYIYLKNKNKQEKTLEKIMTTLYESLKLCIVLVLLQFIIPLKSSNYFISLLILMVYIYISIMFLKLKKKRG